MCSNRKTTASIKNCSDKIDAFHTLLQESDAVIIGAGAGLSTSAGFIYTGKRFDDYFSDFIKKYTAEQPLIYCGIGIYYVPVHGDAAGICLPEGPLYQISGNNIDGFVVTIWRKGQ